MSHLRLPPCAAIAFLLAACAGTAPTSRDPGPRIEGLCAAKSTVALAGAPEGAAIQWMLADKAEGPYAELTGVTGPRCVLPAAFAGHWLKAQIKVGEQVTSVPPVKVADRPGNPNVAFMQKTGWGLSFTFDREYIHRCAATPAERIQKKPDGTEESWDEVLATFDVEAFARDVEATGAGFVLLALGQNSGYYCAPNETLEKYVGCAPHTFCSKRDLPMEIMKALKPKGVAVMLYLPGNPPTHNQVVRKGLDYAGSGDSSPGAATREKWDRVIAEWSTRYGTDLAGWWIDGMYDHNAYDMKNARNWHSRAAALKAGNPACAIALGGCRPTGSHYEDYYNGETLHFGALPRNGQWKNEDPATRALAPAARGEFPGPWWIEKERRMQWLAYAPVGKPDGGWGAWGNRGCARAPKALDDWMKKLRDAGGVAMLDGKVSRFGRIDPDQMALYLATPACHAK